MIVLLLMLPFLRLFFRTPTAAAAVAAFQLQQFAGYLPRWTGKATTRYCRRSVLFLLPSRTTDARRRPHRRRYCRRVTDTTAIPTRLYGQQYVCRRSLALRTQHPREEGRAHSARPRTLAQGRFTCRTSSSSLLHHILSEQEVTEDASPDDESNNPVNASDDVARKRTGRVGGRDTVPKTVIRKKEHNVNDNDNNKRNLLLLLGIGLGLQLLLSLLPSPSRNLDVYYYYESTSTYESRTYNNYETKTKAETQRTIRTNVPGLLRGEETAPERRER